MTESLATTYAKAIDDLAGKIFIPGFIASLLVEATPLYLSYRNAGLFETYILAVVLGLVGSAMILLLLGYISFTSRGQGFPQLLAVTAMPLGFAGLFPDYFTDFNVPFSQVTGVAILAWSFVLIKEDWFDNQIQS